MPPTLRRRAEVRAGHRRRLRHEATRVGSTRSLPMMTSRSVSGTPAESFVHRLDPLVPVAAWQVHDRHPFCFDLSKKFGHRWDLVARPRDDGAHRRSGWGRSPPPPHQTRARRTGARDRSCLDPPRVRKRRSGWSKSGVRPGLLLGCRSSRRCRWRKRAKPGCRAGFGESG